MTNIQFKITLKNWLKHQLKSTNNDLEKTIKESVSSNISKQQRKDSLKNIEILKFRINYLNTELEILKKMNMKDKKKVIFKYNLNVNLIESHTFIIDESYEIDEEEYEIYEIYDDLEDKYGEPIIEVEEDQLITLSTLDMEIIN